MPINIIRADITTLKVDAIVNAANSSLLGGGGVDGAIHRAAGRGLLEECRTLGGCETGQVKITKGYDLKAKYVIHTVGSIWHGGAYHEPELLRACYENSLRLALEYKLESIAFPLISSGAYGYPKDKALEIAVDSCKEFLAEHDMEISIVVYDKGSFDIGKALYSQVRSYIEERFVREEDTARRKAACAPVHLAAAAPFSFGDKALLNNDTVEEALKNKDESFSQMLFHIIDEKGLTDSQCYHRANIDRKLFSKMKKPHYQPKKVTVIAFVIALELDLDTARDLLMRAGYALSHSSEFDIIIEFCIEKKIYDVNRVNEILFKFDQALIGQ